MRAGTIALVVLSIASAARAEVPSGGDTELRTHLAALGGQLDDPRLDVDARARIALEMAATLDRAAQAAPATETRRALWAEAAGVLDGFDAKHPGHAQTRSFQVQAAIYVWARARSWIGVLDANPTDVQARRKAVEALQDCLDRLAGPFGALANEQDTFAQNLRFRMARARADLAECASLEPAARAISNREALDALGRAPFKEPTLIGFAELLEAELLGRLGRFPEALAKLAHLAKISPRPSDREILETRLGVLLGARSFDEARSAIEAGAIDTDAKPALRARIDLAERSGTSVIARRRAAESALFRELASLRNSTRSDAQAVLIASARAVTEPDALQPPDAWDCLAVGAVLAGDPERAGMLERRAAELADANGRHDPAVAFRLRAGAYFFQAGKFADADRLLSRVAGDKSAGAARSRAGMLLALARGRALALKRPGASDASYTNALEAQIKTFPDEPATSEARWLLAKLRLAESDRAGAAALWTAIPHGTPRWLDARLEVAALNQQDLDNQRRAGDRTTVDETAGKARAFLEVSLREAGDELESNRLRLASARLELTPGIGRPSEAMRQLEAIQRAIARPAERDAARRLMILAMAQANRWVEVERTASKEASSPPEDLIGLVRLVDRTAAEADTDLRARRLGYVNRLLLSRMLDRPNDLPPALRSEVRLRQIRALLFSGDEAGARRGLSEGTPPLPTTGDDLLRDLAEVYMRVEAYSLAEDVQRLRTRALEAGTLPWFEARYGLSVASYRAGRAKEAVRLIDATAILHPNLGGESLREKFLRLRQRIEPSQ